MASSTPCNCSSNAAEEGSVSGLDWQIAGYIGFGFAMVYRMPQIYKIYKLKRASEISAYSYITHNGAYVSFILYLFGTGRGDDFILLTYYSMGLIQNMLIFFMKWYYERFPQPTAVVVQDVHLDAHYDTNLRHGHAQQDGAHHEDPRNDPQDSLHLSKSNQLGRQEPPSVYRNRRLWYKADQERKQSLRRSPRLSRVNYLHVKNQEPVRLEIGED